VKAELIIEFSMTTLLLQRISTHLLAVEPNENFVWQSRTVLAADSPRAFKSDSTNVGPSISLKYSAEAFPSLCCPPGFDREIDQQLFVVVRSAYYNRFIGAVFLILDKALNRFVETVEALPQ
jgi:hypothetical protein